MTTITAFMSKDHAGLDALLEEFRRETDAGRAKQLFSDFASRLRAHIGWEEEILFPAFEEKSGMSPDSGPTAVMRMEHRRIESHLEASTDAMESSSSPVAVDPLLDTLAEHNHKEEDVLYPWLDRSHSTSEGSALLARIESTGAG